MSVAQAPAGNLLPRGNIKLGPAISSFSLPAKATCPGATELCKAKCYAARGRFVFGPLKDRLAAFRAFSLSPRFVGAILRTIRSGGISIVRIHVAGDFETPKSVRNWATIAYRSPYTIFYAYTRSWRVPDILPELVTFAALPNVRLWFSEDRETGRSPETYRVRRAFLAVTNSDLDLVDPGVDLVFRDKKLRTPLKRVNGVQVCPAEDGVKRKVGPITCTQCRICFRDSRKANRHEATETSDSRAITEVR